MKDRAGTRDLGCSMIYFSKIEFITDTFYCSDAIQSEFLPDLAYMNVDRPVPHYNVIPPYLVEYFIPQENSSRSGGQQVKQFKFFLGQGNILIVNHYLKFVRVNCQVLNFVFNRLP